MFGCLSAIFAQDHRVIPRLEKTLKKETWNLGELDKVLSRFQDPPQSLEEIDDLIKRTQNELTLLADKLAGQPDEIIDPPLMECLGPLILCLKSLHGPTYAFQLRLLKYSSPMGKKKKLVAQGDQAESKIHFVYQSHLSGVLHTLFMVRVLVDFCLPSEKPPTSEDAEALRKSIYGAKEGRKWALSEVISDVAHKKDWILQVRDFDHIDVESALHSCVKNLAQCSVVAEQINHAVAILVPQQ